ncbi:MAG: heme exporter protein CcmD [Rhodospirillaceae bacterium]|nr:heme exporter protein CcmD [Rhodospirillaceae bacterium]
MSFFEMGGYAVYVWPAFGVGAVVMIGLLVLSIRRLRLREAELKRLEAAGGGRRGRGGAEDEDEQEEAVP